MSYSSFKGQWLGKRVDYDRVYGYQCVDLVKQYLAQEFGLKPGAWGNAIDYWYSTHPDILTKFSRLSTKSARQGDIIIFSGVNGNPYGHIGIADGNATTSAPTLEQNGSTGNGSGVGNDAIRVRAITSTRTVGVLRPKAAKPTTRMPDIGSRVKLANGTTRTTFKVGTTQTAGTIRVTSDNFVYVVRGYDPAYPNRILINSSSAGGNGVALALFYTSGAKIDGWSVV